MSNAPRTLRVLFLIRSLDVGGAQRQLIAMAAGLKQRGHEVMVAVYYGGGAMENDLRRYNVPVHDLRKRGRYDVVPFARRLRRLISQECPTTVYALMPSAYVPASLMWQSECTFRLVWGIRASNIDHDEVRLAERILVHAGALLSTRADAIIANSMSGAAFHARLGYRTERLRVIPNGIDIERFRPDREAAAALRSQLGIESATSVVGMVARFDVMKGHEDFLRALAECPADRSIHAVVAGTGPVSFELHLRSLAESLGVSKRLSWIRDPASLRAVYSALDLLCCPSRYGEGFSNTIAEAMACGVPCVATDVGDSRDIIADTGMTTVPTDYRQLSIAIPQMLAMCSDELSARCRDRIRDRFSIELLITRTEEALRDAGR